MSKVHKVESLDQFGKPVRVLAHVTSATLAQRIAVGQGGKAGDHHGRGRVSTVKVFESFEELPKKLQDQIISAEERLATSTKKISGDRSAKYGLSSKGTGKKITKKTKLRVVKDS